MTASNQPHALRAATQETFKNLLAPLLSRVRAPILVNSFGRSGSTVLFESIKTSAARSPGALSELGRRVLNGTAWSLDTARLHRGRCYKTHGYPTSRLLEPPRPLVVYVFGDPVDATISSLRMTEQHGLGWLAEHCDHLGVPGCSTEDLLDRDALHLEQHLTSWLDQDVADVAMVRYEMLWEKVGSISDFLGFEVHLPERRDRATRDVDPTHLARLHRTFSRMSAAVERLEDFRIINGPTRRPS